MFGHDARGFLRQRAPQVVAAARMFPGHRLLVTGLGLRPTFKRVEATHLRAYKQPLPLVSAQCARRKPESRVF
jgi:hypothetical protein